MMFSLQKHILPVWAFPPAGAAPRNKPAAWNNKRMPFLFAHTTLPRWDVSSCKVGSALLSRRPLPVYRGTELCGTKMAGRKKGNGHSRLIKGTRMFTPKRPCSSFLLLEKKEKLQQLVKLVSRLRLPVEALRYHTSLSPFGLAPLSSRDAALLLRLQRPPFRLIKFDRHN